MHYNRDFYLTNEEKTFRELKLEGRARMVSGLDWNYLIAPELDRDLHEKLLAFSADECLPFAEILPLIASGYFNTAASLVESKSVSESMEEIKQWLIDALNEADDVA